MCSYFEDSPSDPSIDLFNVFVDEFNSAYDKEIRKVKIFTSGSFLDPKEVNQDCA